jgi:hypothetical protein
LHGRDAGRTFQIICQFGAVRRGIPRSKRRLESQQVRSTDAIPVGTQRQHRSRRLQLFARLRHLPYCTSCTFDRSFKP